MVRDIQRYTSRRTGLLPLLFQDELEGLEQGIFRANLGSLLTRLGSLLSKIVRLHQALMDTRTVAHILLVRSNYPLSHGFEFEIMSMSWVVS
jgi:hypothetical protein